MFLYYFFTASIGLFVNVWEPQWHELLVVFLIQN